MKKSMSILFLVVLVLLFNIIPASADTDDSDEPVAKVGESTYNTVKEAVESITEEGTVTLLKDHYEYKSIVIPAGKKIILKDNGKACKLIRGGSRNNKPLFVVEKGAELTLKATDNTKLSLEPDQVTGHRAIGEANNTGNIVHNKGTFNLIAGSIWCGGFRSEASMTGAVYVDEGAKFNMSGGIIHKMDAQGSLYAAPVIVNSSAVFNMSGGEIKDNINEGGAEGTGGGGVLLFSWNDDPVATFNMSGGKITRNLAPNGGGVYLTGNTKFNMTGGEISNNKANGQGGGVCVSGWSGDWKPNQTFFTLDGGTITGNTAINGGGIYVNSDGVTLKSGYIEKNIAEYSDRGWHGNGGGVCVSEVPRVLKIGNTVVTENIVDTNDENESVIGGGLWACPTGSINLSVTNGIAIFNNHAKGNRASGDDVAKVTLKNAIARKGTITLPNRMLGGGSVKWYFDGKIEEDKVGYVNPGVTRFNKDNPGEVLNIKNKSDNYALKAVTTQSAIDRANEEAKLFIRYNKALHGGGIGTNGDVTMPNFGEKEWKIQVKKKWDASVKDTDKKEVKIYLKINNKILDSIVLNNSNSWKGEFTELPDPDTLKGKKITVIEGKESVQPDGSKTIKETSKWNVSYADVINKENHIVSIEVLNKPLPKIDIPKIDISVEKHWDFDQNKDNIPESVTVSLLENGKVSGRKLVLNDVNNWKGKFTNLDVNKDDKEIKYTVKEDGEKDNSIIFDGKLYKVQYSGNKKDGFIITNKETPPKVSPKTPIRKQYPPKTGDGLNTSIYVLVIALSGAGILALCVKKTH